MTPEGKIKKLVKAYLDKIGAYHFWPVQMGYGAKTLDCLACIDGLFIGIETKAPGKKPTPLQELCMEEILNAGGECFVVSDENSLWEMKKRIDIIKRKNYMIKNGYAY